MVTRVLMFETADGVVEHLTAQVPPDADGGMMLPELLSWGGRIWKRGADSVFRLASIWVPDREEFASSIFDEEDFEALRIRETKQAIANAKLSATEIATKVAEEVTSAGERFDLSEARDAMKQGYWIACVKIITEINGDAPKFSHQKIDRIPIEQHIDWARIACFAFEAYNSVGEKAWMTFDGRPVPRWPALNDEVRAKWTAAVKAVVLDEQRRKMEAVNECATAIRHAARDQEAIRKAHEMLAEVRRVLEQRVDELKTGWAEKEDLRVKLRDALVLVDQNRRAQQDALVLKQQLSIAETMGHDLANRIATLEAAMTDLLVLIGANPLSDLAQGTNLAGCIERAKKALVSKEGS